VATIKFVNNDGDDDLIHFGEYRPEIVIGRQKGCDLRMKNNTLSRKHARLTWSDGSFYVEDLGSSNGTFYHRKKVEKVEIEDGETIYFGTFQVRFQLEVNERAAEGEADVALPPVPDEEEGDTGSAPEPSVGPVTEETMGYEAVSREVEPCADGEDDEEEVVSFAEEEPVVAEDEAAATVEDDLLEDGTDVVVAFDEGSDSDVEHILEEEKDRETRESGLVARVTELEEELAGRDEMVRKLALQVEELGNLVSTYEAEKPDEDAELRIAELERAVSKAGAGKASIEKDLKEERKMREVLKVQHEKEKNEARSVEEGLRSKNADLQEEHKRLINDLKTAKDMAGRMEKKIKELEAAPPPKEEGADENVMSLMAALDAINETVSGSRTNLDVLTGMIPEVEEHMDGTDDGSDAIEQVRSSADELAAAVRDVKEAIREARSLIKEIVV